MNLGMDLHIFRLYMLYRLNNLNLRYILVDSLVDCRYNLANMSTTVNYLFPNTARRVHKEMEDMGLWVCLERLELLLQKNVNTVNII